MNLIPCPQLIEQKPGTFKIGYFTNILSSGDMDNMFAPLSLKDFIFDELRLELNVKRSFKCEKGINYILTDDNGEGYVLDINEDNIEIIGGIKGLFYGTQTLKQLIIESGAFLPCVHIEDYPSFSARGLYYDVTRGRIPTMKSLKKQIDELAFFKINQFQLYIEHSFAFEGLSEVWFDKEPLSAADILELDRYCIERNIELVPSVATFGHMHEILLSKSFRHLNELENPKREEYIFTSRAMHYTIDCKNEQSIEFVKNILDQYIPLFTSDKFNICGDETFDLGKGKNKQLAETEGTGKMYVEFIKKVIKHVKSYGKTVMMWADVIANHPENIVDLRDDKLIALSWGYAPDVTDKMHTAVENAGIKQYVCPSTLASSTIFNRHTKSMSNIKAQISHGVKHGAIGVLNTNWLDAGSMCMATNSMPLFAFGADCSWNTGELTRDNSEIMNSISRILYRNENIMAYAVEASDNIIINGDQMAFFLYQNTGAYTKDVSDYIMYDSHFEKFAKNPTQEKIFESYSNIMKDFDGILGEMGKIREGSKDSLSDLLMSIRGIALYQAMIPIIKKYYNNERDIELIYSPCALAVELEKWYQIFIKSWLRENKMCQIAETTEFIKNLCGFLRDLEK